MFRDSTVNPCPIPFHYCLKETIYVKEKQIYDFVKIVCIGVQYEKKSLHFHDLRTFVAKFCRSD